MIPLKSSDRTAPSGARRRGFTLVELMISSGIFVVMISLVMGMVVMQSRFGVSLGHYADMNEYSRKAMTRFEKDMRLVLNVEPGFSDTEVKANLLSPATVAAVVKGPLPVTRVAYGRSSKPIFANGRDWKRVKKCGGAPGAKRRTRIASCLGAFSGAFRLTGPCRGTARRAGSGAGCCR